MRMHETREQAAEKPHILRCARPPRFNVLKLRLSSSNFAQLASEVFLIICISKSNDF